MTRWLAILLVTLAAAPAAAADFGADDFDAADMRLLRNPDIHGDKVVFVHAGDLWLVGDWGGTARRLTSHVGSESQPKFSPDGRWIAFSADYDGNNDVYVMPSEGGEPRRLTWHPYPDRVIDWEPDGRAVRFQSSRTSFTRREADLWRVPVDGGLPTSLGLPAGGLSSWNADGTRLAYNRITREHRTWKRYQGGMAQNIWIYDFAAETTEQVTDWPGSENYPMWHGARIVFNSDRTGRLQLWAYDTGSGAFEQLTSHDEYDVKLPSLGDGRVVYENGGWLWVLDLADGETRRLEIAVRDDRVRTRATFVEAGKSIRGADLGPDAQRAVFAARGEIFTVPAEKGEVRNLSRTPGVHERHPAWSPDGAWIAYFSDASGEYELTVRRSDGRGEPRQVTEGSDIYYHDVLWSPDSRHLLTYDASRTVRLVELDSGDSRRIAQDPTGRRFDAAFSPDSRWIAYARGEENGFRSIFLYDIEEDETHRVTGLLTDDSDPAFAPGGEYLYFASSRHFQPRLGGYDLKPHWTEQDGLYLVVLAADGDHPFPPQSDEVAFESDVDGDEDGDTDTDEDADEDDDGEDGDDADEDDDVPPVRIDLEGLGDRIVELDVEPGNYSSLAATEGHLFYMSAPAEAEHRALRVFVMEDREAEDVLAPCDGYDLSADGEKLLYAAKGSWGIVAAAPGQKPADEPLRTGEMRARSVPTAEWAQMFEDAWRLEGDFFYDPGLHGVDWDRMHERYGRLVPYVSDRRDLNYVLGELIAELGAGHAYVRGSREQPRAERIPTGLLGCGFEPDAEADRYRIVDILTERDWNADQRTPLHGPGIDVAEGDYLLTVDGEPLTTGTNPYALFMGKADRQVTLGVAADPDDEPREVVVEPIRSDIGLRYTAWVEGNRRRVAELSDGRFGYLHLPNTAIGGVQAFAKGYYPQLRMEGLVIDERYNAGGFIPDFLMHILRADFVNLWKPRYGQDWRTPGTAFNGPLVMVSNAHAGSGGDALPYYFQRYGLGKVVGTRTWGGLVGISTGIPLMDGGSVTFPEFGLFNLEGEWDVENHGVEPDIVVDNLPHLVRRGRDPQLERAVAVLLEAAERTEDLPEAPDFPRDR